MNSEDRLIPLTQACRRLGLNPQTIRSRICKGAPTPFPIGKHPVTGGLVVRESDVGNYLAKLFTDHRVDRPVEAKS
jgi:hypothetical protein